MREIAIRTGIVAIVDEEDFSYLSKFTWHINGSSGYAYRLTSRSQGRRRAIFMHREINSTPDGLVTDHINGNKLDNRKENLRTASQLQNARNTASHKGSTSRYKGVCFCKKKNRWRSTIQIDGAYKHIGYFDSEEVAAQAYNQFAEKYFGAFAKLNNICADLDD